MTGLENIDDSLLFHGELGMMVIKSRLMVEECYQ